MLAVGQHIGANWANRRKKLDIEAVFLLLFVRYYIIIVPIIGKGGIVHG